MSSEEKKHHPGAGLDAWLLIGGKQKAVGLIVLCWHHATEALSSFEKRYGDAEDRKVSIRRVQEGWSDLGDELVLSLRRHKALGENKCARCNAKDWASVEVWHGFKPAARAQFERAAGLGPSAGIGSLDT